MNIDAINDVKEYLRDWIGKGFYPTRFMRMQFSPLNRDELIKHISFLSYEEIEINKNGELEDELIVYFLAIYIYHYLVGERYAGELEHKEIKKPRVYQFLRVALERDTLVEPQMLLSLLESRRRDTIMGETIENKSYKIEPFSTIGLTRQHNQDYIDYSKLDDALVLIVADGVGGARDGEVASKLVTLFIIDSLKEYSFLEESEESIEGILRELLFEANQKILDYAKSNSIDKIGTTISVALIVNYCKLFIAHVGDSRIYEFEERGEPRQLTPDHSYPEVLYREGKIEEGEKKDYEKNLLVYVLGKENLKREDIFVQHSYIFDKSLLLCSDGFWDKLGVTKESFTDSFDKLKDDILLSIPSDNVSVIRYRSFEQEEDNCVEYNELYDSNPTLEDSMVITKTKTIENNHHKIVKILIAFIGILLVTLIFVYIFVDKSKESIDSNPIIPKQEEFFRAVKDGNITQTKELIKYIDIDRRDKGHLAIYYAYENLDVEMITFLVKEGIDINTTREKVVEEYEKIRQIKRILDKH